MRPVVFDDFGTISTTIYDRDLLPIDKVIDGPAVIEEPAASTVVFPDQQFFRDKYGFLHIEFADNKSRLSGISSFAGTRR
jgi:N-methylhydantoinase A